MTRVSAILALGLVLCVSTHAARAEQRADVTVVFFDASWCPNCRVFAPVLADGLRAAPPVRRIDIDISDDASWDASTERAINARIISIYNAYVGVTGFATISATDSNEILACVKRPNTAADVARAVNEAITAVRTRPPGARRSTPVNGCPAPRTITAAPTAPPPR